MEPVTARRWHLRGSPQTHATAGELASALGVAPLTARILLQRGVSTSQEGRAFLASRLSDLPDPLLMKGMAVTVGRLVEAIRKGETIAVHGDYDVDGITGTALLVETLRAFGALVDYHIPLRLRDGYGLSATALEEAAARGVRVVLSVDCGVSAVAEAELARRLGLDLLVTDHHQPPDPLPEALSIVNPHQAGCEFPGKELAGVGVAFFVLVALRKALREAGWFGARKEPDLRHALDLVALGTIADVVPLRGINRTLVRVGLEVLEHGSRPGVRALKEVAGVREVTCGAVGFRLAPRLNAAGRLEDAALGVDLLLGSDPAAAAEIAQQLDNFNRERQAIELSTLQQAVERLEEKGEGGSRSILLADERWHPGVIGIVASRLVERYHRPTVLIALENGTGKGSARSIQGFHLYRALEGCREHLEAFGGHAMAAGLSVAADAVPALAARFEEVAGELLGEDDLLPRLAHDGEVLLQEFEEPVVQELATLAPFGIGNPEPAFLARSVQARQISRVGENHLRFTAWQEGCTRPCIAFGMAGRLEELAGPVDLLFAPGINEWRGNRSVQLQIKDFRPAGGH